MTDEAALRAQLADALRRVAENSVDWRPWAALALYNAATETPRLTSDEVWRELTLRDIPPPSEPRAMGPVMLEGVRKGWLIPSDDFVVNPVPATGRNMGRPQRVYLSQLVGAPYAEWPSRNVNLTPVAIPEAPPPATVRQHTAPCPKCGNPVVLTPSVAPSMGVGRCGRDGHRVEGRI